MLQIQVYVRVGTHTYLTQYILTRDDGLAIYNSQLFQIYIGRKKCLNETDHEINTYDFPAANTR